MPTVGPTPLPTSGAHVLQKQWTPCSKLFRTKEYRTSPAMPSDTSSSPILDAQSRHIVQVAVGGNDCRAAKRLCDSRDHDVHDLHGSAKPREFGIDTAIFEGCLLVERPEFKRVQRGL